jgi:hypothetical protein
MLPRLVSKCFIVLFIIAPCSLQAAEYKNAEMTPPRSVDDVDSTLANVAGSILFYRGPVIKGIDDWRKTKGPFLRDGHLLFNFRTMDFQTRFANLDDVKAWAAPGELAYRSGLWGDIVRIGASVYGSYELSGNDLAGASGMLQLNGDSITTLGQAYLEFNWKGLISRLYRQAIDIPYLNKNDSRMIPNTFEAYGVGREQTSFDFLVGYVDKIKLRNREDFISMGEVLGIDNNDSGMTVLGAIWKPDDTGFDIGATYQRTPNLFRLIYAEANWKNTFNGLGLLGSAQYTRQESIGDHLLGDFKTSAGGLKLITSYDNIVFSLAYTKTDDGAKIKSPFGGRPGYTTSMLNDFDRANEKSWRASLSYHFDAIGLPDWSINASHIRGRDALEDKSFLPLGDIRETDFTLDYKPEHGRLRGLWLRMRYARLKEDNRGEVANQVRIILNYSFNIL